ncbi:hypothetical protein N0V90_013196 [Kalmusia sp. IMI 367209]|nr:hypothetical protein N0V90_013196 [Kalmusia sp. IMI 367209]
MLAIDNGSAFLVIYPKDSSIVRLIQPKIDPKLIRDWLQHCQDNHSDTDHFPETIVDAVNLTQALGLRYLWIDRYCIDHSDRAEVKEQVTQMDLIYRHAYLTIIAAAGATPHYGLPGVGNRCRSPQLQGMVLGEKLVSTLPDPISEIKQAIWYHRGWTYQEGILSPRRLIFTDRQMYFECSGMYCCEALNFPLGDLHMDDGKQFYEKYCHGINIGLFPKELGKVPWEVVKRIEEYTKRQLTKPSDILNGISGILNAFKRSCEVRHCAGVPMIPSGRKRTGKSKEYKDKWPPKFGFCAGLSWAATSPSERRPGFSSWSWTSCRSEIKWGIKDEDWRYLEPNDDLELSIQLENGEYEDVEEFHESYGDTGKKVSGTLHVSTSMYLLEIQQSETSDSDFQYEVKVELEELKNVELEKEELKNQELKNQEVKYNATGLWSFTPTYTTPIPAGTKCFGIDLCHTANRSLGKWYVLVIREVDNGCHERVGFGTMDGTTRPTIKTEPKSIPSPTVPPPRLTPKKLRKELYLR